MHITFYANDYIRPRFVLFQEKLPWQICFHIYHWVCVCVCVCMHVCMCISIDVCMYVCTYLCIYVNFVSSLTFICYRVAQILIKFTIVNSNIYNQMPYCVSSVFFLLQLDLYFQGQNEAFQSFEYLINGNRWNIHYYCYQQWSICSFNWLFTGHLTYCNNQGQGHACFYCKYLENDDK